MAQLKEGSIIRKSTGDEIIATLNDITGGGGDIPTKISDLENDSGFITSSEIPSSLPANGGNADTVGGFTVGVNVPANAKFTDTIYEHPSTHSASMIVESTNRRFVSDTEKATWNNKWDYNETTIKSIKVNNAINSDTVNGKTVAENVPSGAKFTDTVTTVNGKTGAITKSDITALGIPAQDTVYTHPPGTNPHGTTKSDVGLGNVTNDKQMPISGGDFTGISKAHNNTSYTVAQLRNVILSTDNAVLGSMQDGDIWIKYK